MKTSKKIGMGLLTLGLAATLVACGSGKDAKTDESAAGGKDKASDFSAALVTDLGGVDDKSFNQSAWEGLQEWGKEAGKEKGTGGFNYYQSNSDSEFTPNLNSAIDDGFNLVFGIGFKLQPAIEEIAGVGYCQYQGLHVRSLAVHAGTMGRPGRAWRACTKTAS